MQLIPIQVVLSKPKRAPGSEALATYIFWWVVTSTLALGTNIETFYIEDHITCYKVSHLSKGILQV